MWPWLRSNSTGWRSLLPDDRVLVVVLLWFDGVSHLFPASTRMVSASLWRLRFVWSWYCACFFFFVFQCPASRKASWFPFSFFVCCTFVFRVLLCFVSLLCVVLRGSHLLLFICVCFPGCCPVCASEPPSPWMFFEEGLSCDSHIIMLHPLLRVCRLLRGCPCVWCGWCVVWRVPLSFYIFFGGGTPCCYLLYFVHASS